MKSNNKILSNHNEHNWDKMYEKRMQEFKKKILQVIKI